MSEHPVTQVVAVYAQKVSDFEDRLNAVLRDIPADQLAGIDYVDTETYGLCAFVRYVAG